MFPPYKSLGLTLPAYISYSNDYLDIYTKGRKGKRRWSWRWLSVTPALVRISFVLNLAFIYYLAFRPSKKPIVESPPPRSPSNVLDNYYQMQMQDILSEDSRSNVQRIDPKKHAIVTALYTDAFAPGVATLGHTLRERANTSAQLIMLYFPDRISLHALCTATASGFIPHPISRIAPPGGVAGEALIHPHFLDQFSKLNVWSLGPGARTGSGTGLGLESLVYLDADTIAYHNFDELLTLPHTFAAVPDVYLDEYRGFTVDINAGVLVVRPDTAVFDRMVRTIKLAGAAMAAAEAAAEQQVVGETAKAKASTTTTTTKGEVEGTKGKDEEPVFTPRGDAEQAFLNDAYGAQVVRLPYVYNANLAIKMRNPKMWDVLRGNERKRARAKAQAKPKPQQGDAQETNRAGPGASARIVHYTLVKPFLQGDYEEVPFAEVENFARSKLGDWDGAFREEVEDWIEAWQETTERYADNFALCGHAV